MYKTIKLNKEEIKEIKILLSQAIIDLKRQNRECNELDEIYIDNKISRYKKLLNYFSYIER